MLKLLISTTAARCFTTFEINLETDHKHEEQKPKLTQSRQHRQGRRRKEIGKGARKEPAKKRRAKNDARCHLTDYTRLANALEDPAQCPSCQQNGSDGEYQLFCVHVPKACLNSFIKAPAIVPTTKFERETFSATSTLTSRVGHPPQFGEAPREIADSTTSAREGLLPGLAPGLRTSGPTRFHSRRILSHPPGPL